MGGQGGPPHARLHTQLNRCGAAHSAKYLYAVGGHRGHLCSGAVAVRIVSNGGLNLLHGRMAGDWPLVPVLCASGLSA